MSRLFRSFSAVVSIFLAVAGSSLAQDGAQNNTIYDVDLSADGKSYAILRQYGDQRIVAIYDADDANKAPLAVGLGDLPTSAFAWGGNNHILVRVSADRTGVRTSSGLQTIATSRWISIEKKTGKIETLFGDETGNDYNYFIGSAGNLITTLPAKPGYALFSRVAVSIQPTGPTRMQSGDDKLVYDLQEINLANRQVRRVEAGKEDTIDWVVNEAGAPIARIDKISGDRGVYVHARQPGQSSFGRVAEIRFDEGPYKEVSFYGSAERSGAAQALVTGQDDVQKLVEFDLTTGAFGAVIDAPSSGSFSAVNYDYRQGKAITVMSGGAIRHLDEDDSATITKLESAVPGSVMMLLSKSVGGDRMLVKAFKNEGIEEYYFFDANEKRLELIAAQ